MIITNKQWDLQSIGNFKEIRSQFDKDNRAATQNEALPSKRLLRKQ